jgi:hypothetical protein
VLKRVGCPGCTSGVHLFWQAFSEFTVNEAGEVRPVASGVTAE